MWLGIETSSLVSSVALMDEHNLIGELTIQAGLTHSEQLIPHIDMLLRASQVKKNELKGIIVSIGPGSFTGLRIGMGTAKAMAYALQIPLYGVMTMDSLARNVSLQIVQFVPLLMLRKSMYMLVYIDMKIIN